MAKDTPEIQDYAFGRIEVDGQTFTNDLIILPDRVVANWWREEGHVLHAKDLHAVLELEEKPETLIVGQGAEGRMRVARDAREALTEAGIELIAESTEQACVTYNALRSQGGVVAALHLTC
ncbi:MAG: Mth938-like domain-containing protein [Anaerolineae bacterium]